MDSPKPIAHLYRVYFVHSHSQKGIVSTFAFVIENALMQQYGLAETLNGDVVLPPNVIDHPTLSGQS